MQPFRQKLHRDLPRDLRSGATTPQYRARPSRRAAAIPSTVPWRSNLPSPHMFPVDNRLHGDEPGQPAGAHGRPPARPEGLPESDGYPEAWFTRRLRADRPVLRQQDLPLPQRPGGHRALVSRSRDRDHAPEPLRRARGLLLHPRCRRGPSRSSQRGLRGPADDPGSAVQRGRLAALPGDRHRGRSDTRVPESGSPSSSAIPCWSTARCGRFWRSSRGSTGSASSTPPTPGGITSRSTRRAPMAG